MDKIGVLKPVEIREVWKREDRDFTPWLADNSWLLGSALGMKLLHEQTEAWVGAYRADLVFKVETTEKVVVVENMLDEIDHKHLGQLITYAAGLEADYAVLISRAFREEHRSALNWLNSISEDTFGFFGIALEAWRINDGPPAPRLRVVVKPDSQTRERKRMGVGPLYEQFWAALLPEFRKEHPNWTNRTKGSGSWIHFSAGRSGFDIRLKFCKPAGRYRLGVDLYIDLGDVESNQRALDHLKAQQGQFEKDLGELEWEPLDHARATRISLYYPDAEEVRVSDEDRWPAWRDWLVDAAGKMRSVFGPAVQALPR